MTRRTYLGSHRVGPDFVILGYRDEQGRHVVWGSTDLHDATMEGTANRPEELFGMMGFSAVPRAALMAEYTLTVRMGSLVMALGSSYQEALAALMRAWNPDDRPTRGHLPEAPRGLPEGRP